MTGRGRIPPRRPGRALAALLALWAGAAAAAPAPASAPAPVAPASAPAAGTVAPSGDLFARTRIDARLDPAARHLAGTVVIDVENRGATARDGLDLWLYPNALATRPAGLDEVNFFWEYPRFFDPAAMAVEAVRAAGAPARWRYARSRAGERTRLRVALPAAVGPGARTTLEVRFTVRLPQRFGALGCTGEGCRLMFGWYPMLADGEHALPALGDVDVRLAVPAGDHVVIGGVYLPPEARAGAPARGVVRGVAYAPVAVLHRLHRVTRVHRGIRLTYLCGYRPPPDSEQQPLPYVVEDFPRLALDDAQEALDMLATLGEDRVEGEVHKPGEAGSSSGPTAVGEVHKPGEAGSSSGPTAVGEVHKPGAAGSSSGPTAVGEVVMLEGELRRDLAQAHGPLVLVSDQLYRIFPAQRFRKFHTLQLVRALYGSLLVRRLAATERHEDLGWAPDALASYFVDLYTIWRYRRTEFARDVLKYVSFVPAIDQIIYAPKVNFASAYFGDVAEPEGLRRDPARWNNRDPRGRLVYEKLKDLLGLGRVARIAARAIGGAPLRAAAGRVAGRDLAWFFAQWLGPYPAMNYRIAVRASERVGTRWRHRVVVVRDYAQVEEPVEVLLVDQAGDRCDLRWDGRGRRGALGCETAAPLRVVQIDPRGRLVQRYPDRPDDARFDDREPPRLKLLYNGFAALFNFSNITANLVIDFSLRRVFDLRNSVRFLLFHTDTDQIGGRVAYYRYFGRQVDPNHLTSGVSLGLSASRLNPDYASDAGVGPQPGTRVGLGFSGFYDDRYTIIDPWRAWSLYCGLGYSFTIRDSGRTLPQGSVDVEGIRLQELAPGHVLAFDADVAATWGTLALRNQLVALGGPGLLRGYAYNELLGRARALLRIEYRHSFIQTLTWNLGHLFYLRGFGGALFAEGGAVSPCDGYAPTGDGLFADVGYSLRGFFDYLGVSQNVMNLDFAVPLRRNVVRRCRPDGAAEADILAGQRGYYITISFGPSF